MQINSIEIKGIFSYKDLSIIKVPVGITGITGIIENVDGKSNGAGKSAIVNSLLFALYGVGDYDRIEDIWNDALLPSEDAFVRVNFYLNGNNYIAERGRKGKTTYFDVFENDKIVGSSIKESQEFINQLLGMDYRLFLVSVFFSQGDLSSFIEMDPKNRKDYIDSIVDLEVWREAGRKCLREYNKETEESENLKNLIYSSEKRLTELSNEILENEKTVKNLPNLKNNKKEKSERLESLKEISYNVKILGEKKIEVANKINEKNNLEVRKKSLENNMKSLAEEYSTNIDRIEHDENYNVGDLAENIVKWEKEEVDLNKKIEELNKIIAGLFSEVAYNESTLDGLAESRKLIDSRICDRCNRPFSEEEAIQQLSKIDNLIEESKKVKETLTNKISTITNNELDHLTKNLLTIRDDLNKAKHRITENSRLKNSVLTLSRDYEVKNAVCISEIKSISESLIRLHRETDEINSLIQDIEKVIPVNVESEIAELKDSISTLDSTIEDANIKQGILQKLQTEEGIVRNSIGEDKNILKDKGEALYYLSVLNTAFKDIPTKILKESVISIERYANDIIRSVYPKFRVKIFEDETKKNRPLIIAFEVNGKYRNYRLLSGGQKSICAIGLRIGFNRIIAEKAKVSLKFLVLDEIFGALDKVNRDEVMRILNSLVKLFPQILVITHTEEASLFPHIISVHMDASGVSTII